MKTETLLLLGLIGVGVYLWTRPAPLSSVNNLEQPPTLDPRLNALSPSYDPAMAYQFLASMPRPTPQ